MFRSLLATTPASIALFLALIATFPALHAHFCGPAELELQVGETLTWRITADLVETESVYTPTLSGPANVVQVFPDHQFSSRHGVFVFTGLSPGTNTLSVHWLYTGNGANAICNVTIKVVADPRPISYSTVPREGSLVAWDHSVPADTLRGMINRFIPAESEKLFVLTECFGGNIIYSPAFDNAPNTCIISATVPNQTGKYGGYHDDAARGLKPEAGRTAHTVHSEGVQGKTTAIPGPGETNTFAFHFRNSEWPLTGGTMAPEAFSLEPITPTSRIQSRHIIIFMGEPETKNIRVETHGTITVPSPYGTLRPISDNVDRDTIKQAFAGQLNTTVITVGGTPAPGAPDAGQNGWDGPGSSYALSRAIRAMGEAIAASENPAREQFILFVGDHGDTGYQAPPSQIPSAAGSSIELPNLLEIVHRSDELHTLITQDPNSAPSLRVEIAPSNSSQLTAASFTPLPQFAPGSFTAALSDDTGNRLTLDSFTQFSFDWDEDGQVEPADFEYTSLTFPMTEGELLRKFAGKTVNVTFNNHSATGVILTRFTLDYGASPRTDYVVPPPRIVSTAIENGQFVLTSVALQSYRYALDFSTDLVNWTPVLTNRPFQETFTLTVPIAEPAANYRLRWIDPLAQ